MPLTGREENKDFLDQAIKELRKILPAERKVAIAKLHFNLGHTTRWIREEVVNPALALKILVENSDELSFADDQKKEREQEQTEEEIEAEKHALEAADE